MFGCPVPVPISLDSVSPATPGAFAEIAVRKYDVVIISQACDIEQGKVENIILCPLSRLDDVAPPTNLRAREELRRGFVIGRHLLNRAEDFDFHVVEFRHVFGLPKTFLLEYAEKAVRRLRLLPPYREHLAQAFARFFMRVGLPMDIPPFISKG